MATAGHYSLYAALQQTSVEGPEFADVVCVFSLFFVQFF
jgi:hypothetical protein